MAKVEVFVTRTCPYCVRAKALLDKKGVAYDVVDVSDDMDARAALVARADGRRTVPQIFINNVGVGGCDDLYALELQGKLDQLLSA